MKHLLRSLLFIVIFTNGLFAQKKLTLSRQSGYYTYIYKITDQEAFAVAAKANVAITDALMHSLVDSFKVDVKRSYLKKLPFGNYLYVTPVASNLEYSLEQIGNVNLQFINNLKDFQFSITDLKGEQLSDAKVTIGKNKQVKYDPKARLYVSRKGIKPNVIVVNYEGINNYFTFNEQKPWVRPKRAKADPRYRPAIIKSEPTLKYTGYMVFNKPMFKPLDTVRFKAYILNAKGKTIHDKVLRMELQEQGDDEGHILGMIKPYRDGGYEHSFVLADSLDINLDEDYELVLKERKGDNWTKVYSSSFRYEDYELKAINFTVRTDKQVHMPGDPITIYMKAADENDLTVPDGRVEIEGRVYNVSKFYGKQVFVGDSLWTKHIKMDPVGETKLVIPDGIFPKADLEFSLSFTFLNSNNERQTAQRYLSFNLKKETVKASLKGDSLLFDYLQQGRSAIKKGVLISYFKNGLQCDSAEIQLPAAVRLDYKVNSYKFKTVDGFENIIPLRDLDAELSVSSSHTKDSLKLAVVNPHHIPFWYTVFSDQEVWFKGYTSRLDTLVKHRGNKIARIQLNYLWGGEEYSKSGNAMYNAQQLDLKLDGPDVVYPGQAVHMQINVTDAEGIPVKDVDVTALAYTSKFNTGSFINIPYFGREFSTLKSSGTINVQPTRLNGNLLLDWQKWGKELGLDTIEYYRFSNPKELYVNLEAIKDTVAQVSPFLVKNGRIEPVSIVYIDEDPVFFSQADQLQRYVFSVVPGLHRIKLRSTNYEATLNDFELPKGMKTIISINADDKNTKAVVIQEKEILNDAEARRLNEYLIRVQGIPNEEKTTIATYNQLILLNPPPYTRRSEELLVGPLMDHRPEYSSGKIHQYFFRESGYTYTFLQDFLKQKSSGNPYLFSPVLNNENRGNIDYSHHPLKQTEVDSIWNEYLNLRSHTTQLFNNRRDYYSKGQLRMELDTALAAKMPYVKNILLYKCDQPDFIQINPGNNSSFYNLEAGLYHVLYLFKDNRYFTVKDVKVQEPGQNYFEWSDVKILPADQLSIGTDQHIKSTKIDQYDYEAVKDKIAALFNGAAVNPAMAIKVSGRTFDDKLKTALPGVLVKVKGLRLSILTDAKGYFSLTVPKTGVLVFEHVNCDRVELAVKDGKLDSVFLHLEDPGVVRDRRVYDFASIDKNLMTDIYKKARATGLLEEVVMSSPGLQIRGKATLSAGNKQPLYIVDGLPASADATKIDPSLVADMVVMKGDEASAIYGSRGADGVIIINTKAGNKTMNAGAELVDQQQTMRTDFSDYAIWQPKLFTDATGKVKFMVKFPDDITSWNTKLIAMNGKRQSGITETTIRSFKILSANFISPQFALRGDSIKVIGKLMNYSPKAEQVLRKFSYNGTEQLSGQVNFKNAHIDTMSVVAKGKDSLQFEYTMKQDNGYFDGELRKIPLLEKGVLETKGYFNVLIRDTIINYHFDAALGRVSLRAETSVFPTLLDEMEKLRNYEYLCNEQMASKLKALLLEKTVRKYLGNDFKNEKAIKELIKKLIANKRPEGTWGWWQSSNTELWISLHVTEALLEAQKQGYAISLDKLKIQAYLTNKLSYDKSMDQVMAIKLLRALDEKANIKDLVLNLEKQKAQAPNQQSLYEKLQIMRLKQLGGIAVDTKELLTIKKKTMFGNSYWGDDRIDFWDNSIQNTLLAYQILKTAGKNGDEQDQILRYFLEQRKNGQWRNTYESSLILETILPDLLQNKKTEDPVSLTLNKTETVSNFPFTKTVEASAPLSIGKKGTGPVYITAYQQFNNSAPEKVSKDFTVNSWFEENGRKVVSLKAGKLSKLKVEVEVHADADYVMIEIPIPASCSYENKVQQFWGIETHREYFKHKTSIFCAQLKKGKYSFEIDLMPRYSGHYSLNPAKAEMMYFPVFYGREGMKSVTVNY